MVMYNGPFPPFPHHFFVFCFKDCRNTFATYLQYPNGKTAERVAGAFSFTFRARGVIRFLLECNISYRRSRCVNSLIRGDKYRRDTSPKQTQLARRTDGVGQVRQESETNDFGKEGSGGRRRTRFYPSAFGGPHRRERHPSLPRGVRGVIVCPAPAPANPVCPPARPFRLTPN